MVISKFGPTVPHRLPSRGMVLQVFAICSVPIHIWAIIATLIAVPSWILSMTIWEMLSVMAYPLVFALLESLLMLAGLVSLAFVLPANLFRDRFVSQSSVIVLLFVAWGVFMQLWGQNFQLWSLKGVIGFVVLLGLIILASIANSHSKKSQELFNSLAERLVLLSFLYLVIDGFFILVMIYNNLIG